MLAQFSADPAKTMPEAAVTKGVVVNPSGGRVRYTDMTTQRLSRGSWICGVCAMGAALAAPAFALPARADDHSQEIQIGQQVYNDQRKQNQILDTSPYYPVAARGRRQGSPLRRSLIGGR